MLKLLKSNLIMLAMLLAIGSAVAFKAEKQILDPVKWANNNGTWEEVNDLEQSDEIVTRDYKCTADPMTCTAEFPDGTNPTDPGATPSNIVHGIFAFE